MKKKLVFDMGSVLVHLSYPYALDGMGLAEDAKKAILAVGRIPGLWDMLDRDALERARGAELYSEYVPGFEKEAEYAFTHMTEFIRPVEKNVRVLRSAVRSGYECYYLSNFQKDNWKTMKEIVGFFPLFSGGTVSWSVGYIKPEKEIYECFLRDNSLNAQDCLFIDDLEANTRVAAELGFDTITLRPEDNLEEKLKEKGILL